jgi:signal transduction histidine kinase/CheY-like chemotaxis protein
MMTPWFARLRLRTKLILAVSGVGALTAALACVAVLAGSIFVLEQNLVEDTTSIAQVVAQNSAGALAFQDPAAAARILSSLAVKDEVLSAALYDDAGAMVADYQRPGSNESPPEFAGLGITQDRRSIVVRRPIVHDQEGTLLGTGDSSKVLGSVAIRAGRSEVLAQSRMAAAILAIVLVVSTCAGIALAAWLQSFISKPLLSVAEAAHSISRDGDYSVRVPQPPDPDLGRLTEAFNLMLGRIEVQHRDILAVGAELEVRVEARVADLTREIAEREAAQNALVKSEEQLRQAQKMEAVGRLAGGVAHDFNNLLGVILGYGEMMLRGKLLDDVTRRRVEQIQRAGERAATLTRQLLAFSRKQVIAPRPIDLGTLVTDAGKMLERVIGEDVALRIVAEPGLPTVLADPGQVEQVLMNLVVNARDAMPRGGVLTVTSARCFIPETRQHAYGKLSRGSYVLLSVEDTGCGMDAGTQAQMFEPFFTTKDLGKGTGLGLSTVYGIVEQSGASLLVRSAPGQGSTFGIYFPTIDELPMVAEHQKPAAAAGRCTETVLLAEDDDSLRGLVREMLESEGYRVLTASSGPEALRIAEAEPGAIDILVTDVVMPAMGGHQLAEFLRSRRPGIRILFVSGYSDEAIESRGELLPGTQLLAKPFTPDEILRCLRGILDGPAVAPLLGQGPKPFTTGVGKRRVRVEDGPLSRTSVGRDTERGSTRRATDPIQ